jgi:hypothetical protein
MAGKPGTQLDDDDLIVELETSNDDFAPPTEREEIEAAHTGRLESPTLPDTEEEDPEAIESRAPAAKNGESDDGAGEEVEREEAFARESEAEQRIRQVEANSIWSQAQAMAEVVDTKRNAAQVGLNTLNDRIEMVEAHLAAAEEAGDTVAKRRAEADIRKMETMKAEIEAGLRSMPDPQAILNEGRQKASAALAAVSKGRKIGSGIEARHPLAERWASSNGWMKVNSRANKYVIDQSTKMAASGSWDPDSPSFYSELAKRVQLAFPNLKVSELQAQKRGPGKAQMRTPVAPGRSAGGSAVRQANGKSRYTITASEQAKMRNMRLDPTNKAHQRAWAKVRIESAQRERQEGR